MGTTRLNGQPITVTLDGPPQLNADSAAALLKLVQHLVALQAEDHGRDDTTAIAS
jgi:hypothetical protein